MPFLFRRCCVRFSDQLRGMPRTLGEMDLTAHEHPWVKEQMDIRSLWWLVHHLTVWAEYRCLRNPERIGKRRVWIREQILQTQNVTGTICLKPAWFWSFYHLLLAPITPSWVQTPVQKETRGGGLARKLYSRISMNVSTALVCKSYGVAMEDINVYWKEWQLCWMLTWKNIIHVSLFSAVCNSRRYNHLEIVWKLAEENPWLFGIEWEQWDTSGHLISDSRGPQHQKEGAILGKSKWRDTFCKVFK